MRSVVALLRIGACALALAALPDIAKAKGGPCADLARLSGDDVKVLESRAVAAGSLPAFSEYDPSIRAPEHCLFRGSFGERIGMDGQKYEIRFELRMPTNWNGKFLFEGGGNMDGVDWPAYGTLFHRVSPSALERGFAVVRTNSGHTSPDQDTSYPRWAIDQQARIDYGFQALDRVTVTAKKIVSAFYGRPPERSYFMGCSNGGRQALLVSQRYPTYFDGVVAGNAAFNLSRLMPRLAWNTALMSRIAQPEAGAFSQADTELVAALAVRQCDAQDGLADGLIQDIAACRLDVTELTCKGKKTASCLTERQVDVYNRLIEGPRDPRGEPYYQPIPYDSGPAMLWAGPEAADPALESDIFMNTLRYHSMTPPNPSLNALDVGFPDVLDAVRSTAQLNDAESTMMNTFAERAKLLIYHGSSDYILSSFEIAHWYDQLQAANGRPTQDWARLFLVPGMGHCDGGAATDQFDPLSAIQDWVEDGKAPDRIIATGKSFPGVSRPLCPWPQVARYEGGDPKNADSFQCRSSTAPTGGPKRG